MLHWSHPVGAFVPLAALLAGCGGGGPPSDAALKAIENAVLGANTAVFDGNPQGVAVVDIDLKGWEKQEWPGGEMPALHHNEWTAKLRFQEPLVLVVVQINGTKVVRVVADEGEEVAFSGDLTAIKIEGDWQVEASANTSLMDAGPWQPLWDRTGGITMGYEVYEGGNMSVAGRGAAFRPMSTLQPCVVEGSPEEQKLRGGG
ncbi:MAG: hypothetical protein EYC70_06890 [Planctomycetota bacterium]|nr:MAG: hypothetical protein EYC70_06890 [Planctomycetota bacterium]